MCDVDERPRNRRASYLASVTIRPLGEPSYEPNPMTARRPILPNKETEWE